MAPAGGQVLTDSVSPTRPEAAPGAAWTGPQAWRDAGSAETRGPPAAATAPQAGSGQRFGRRTRRERRLHLGGRRRAECAGLRLPQPRECARAKPRGPRFGGGRRGKAARSRVMAKRPSDRRSPGRNPGPQGAFEVSMINVSCNSH